jgi:hypothetical protein
VSRTLLGCPHKARSRWWYDAVSCAISLTLRVWGTNPLHDLQPFEQASRGPWRAMLQGYLEIRQIAYIGAMVTLLALASDSLIQQSVSYPRRSVERKHQTAGIPYSHNFAYLTSSHAPCAMTAASTTVSFTQIKHLRQRRASDLPSGNFTFEPFASLGVRSQCVDVTSLLEYTTGPGDMPGAIQSYGLPNGHMFVEFDSGPTNLNMTSTSAIQALKSDALDVY